MRRIPGGLVEGLNFGGDGVGAGMLIVVDGYVGLVYLPLAIDS